jgi:putative hydrolases of HD superfamily
MAKALIRDITLIDEVKRDKKNRQEEITMDYFTNSLLRKVNSRIIGREIKDIWYKYKNGKTLESKFICDINKFELIL